MRCQKLWQNNSPQWGSLEVKNHLVCTEGGHTFVKSNLGFMIWCTISTKIIIYCNLEYVFSWTIFMNDVNVTDVPIIISLIFHHYIIPNSFLLSLFPFRLYFPIIMFPLYPIPSCIPHVPSVGSSSSLSLGSLSQNWPKNSCRNCWLVWERSTLKRRSRVFLNAVWWFHVSLTIVIKVAPTILQIVESNWDKRLQLHGSHPLWQADPQRWKVEPQK